MSVVECETARFAADLAYADIPERVRHQAKRSILNIVGTALAGAGEPAAETALAVMSPFSCLFLCSPMSRGITGSTIFVDAGYHIMGV